MDDVDLTHLPLDVYDTKDGPWNPEHGELVVPDDWEFLPRGDAFVTRRVKASGTYWLLWRPRGRNRPHRRLLGVWAPRATIEVAQALATESAEARGKRRDQGSRQRDRQEVSYRGELSAAVHAWLDFTDDVVLGSVEVQPGRERVAPAAFVEDRGEPWKPFQRNARLSVSEKT